MCPTRLNSIDLLFASLSENSATYCAAQCCSGSDTRAYAYVSGNFGRSQGVRRMLSAFTKNMIILLVIVGQIIIIK